jgi:hypothetical protein
VSAQPESRQSASRYRMVKAPAPEFEPQVGWTYELRPSRKSFLKLRLVELPGGTEFSTIFETEIHPIWLGLYFEEVA